MPYRTTAFVNQYFYHIYNRGIEKRSIFSTGGDFQRFLFTLYYYQFEGPKPKLSNYKRFRDNNFSKNSNIVQIISYCLMPNHFHLLLRQTKDGGIQEFMRKALNSYTKYFNTRYKRVGPLLQGEFKAVLIESDEQLLHVSRYIHLNPYVSNLVKDPGEYSYSSYLNFIKNVTGPTCIPEPILSFFKKPEEYKSFVQDYQSYALELEKIKHLLIEQDDEYPTPGVGY